MLFNVLRKVVRQKRPDAIVCTYLFCQGILDAIFAAEEHRIPLLTVVTDLVIVNRLWFHPVADLCLIPPQTVYDLALETGLPPEKLKITGLFVRPDLARENQDQAAIRLSLGWHRNLFTVLAVGSKRVEHLNLPPGTRRARAMSIGASVNWGIVLGRPGAVVGGHLPARVPGRRPGAGAGPGGAGPVLAGAQFANRVGAE